MNMTECESLSVQANGTCGLVLKNRNIEGVQSCKNLAITSNKKESKQRISKGRALTRALNNVTAVKTI